MYHDESLPVYDRLKAFTDGYARYKEDQMSREDDRISRLEKEIRRLEKEQASTEEDRDKFIAKLAALEKHNDPDNDYKELLVDKIDQIRTKWRGLSDRQKKIRQEAHALRMSQLERLSNETDEVVRSAQAWRKSAKELIQRIFKK